MARKVACAVTRGSKPKGMGRNCSCEAGALLLAPDLLAPDLLAAELLAPELLAPGLLAPELLTAGMVVAGEAVRVEVAVAAGEEGVPVAVGSVVSEVAGEDTAAGVEEGTAGPLGSDVGEEEAVDGDTTGADVTGLAGAAGEAVNVVGLAAVAGLAVVGLAVVGLAAVDRAGVVMPGVGDSVVTGTAVMDGKGSDCGDGVGICTEVDAGVGAGATGEMVGCDEEGENRGVEGIAYGEATCKSLLKLDDVEAAA